MTDIQKMVAEFHEVFGHPNRLGETPNAEHERKDLRFDLIEEEYIELFRSVGEGYELRDWDRYSEADTVEYADALGDIVYVCFGAALEAGIDLNAVIREIHASNMSKLGADGKPIYREDGKVLKGPNFFQPKIKEVLGL